MAVQMGGVLIKMGQFLSARADVLPEEITSELSGLQDEVPPEDFNDIRKLAESELGAPLDEKYDGFNEEPLAAASLGQVHRARLQVRHAETSPDWIDVVVKIQRPDIEMIIATDLAALRTVSNWLMRYKPISRRADIPALLSEFSRVLYEEIDYLAEGRNAETFAENFKEVPGVRIPGVVWSLTTRRVLTLEDVYAIKITDYEQIVEAGINLDEVAERVFDIYLYQIFENGFFHADPHPGNYHFLGDGRVVRGPAHEGRGFRAVHHVVTAAALRQQAAGQVRHLAGQAGTGGIDDQVELPLPDQRIAAPLQLANIAKLVSQLLCSPGCPIDHQQFPGTLPQHRLQHAARRTTGAQEQDADG